MKIMATVGASVADRGGVARVVGVRCDVGVFKYNPLRYVYLPLILR